MYSEVQLLNVETLFSVGLNLELLFIEGKMVEDNTVLSDLGVQSGQTVQVEIQSADPINRPLHYRKASPAYKLPDKVNVKVEVGK